MPALDYQAFDCDNHYYEALDAFTRHVPKAMQPRCVQWAEIDGRKHHAAIRMPVWIGPYARAPARGRTRSGWVHMPESEFRRLPLSAFCQHTSLAWGCPALTDRAGGWVRLPAR